MSKNTTLKNKFLTAISLFFVVNLLLFSVLLKISLASNDRKESLPSSTTIVLTESGFQPKTISIKKGTTITFKTTKSQPFWPASDPHPVHTIFPAFDPKKPVEAKSTWKFTFNKVGVWEFHDHLAPLFRGTIIVTDTGQSPSTPRLTTTNVKDCQKLTNKEQCWQDTLLTSIRTNGLKDAYKNFAYLFNNEPDFAENCHSFTHLIGEAAYKEFKQGKDFPVTEQVSYCSYGFFHGFIEAMMQEDHNLSQARTFCDYIDKQLKSETSTINACLHGIGHGVTDGSDPRAHGSEVRLISPGLKLCETVGKTDFEVKMCATGVFNALAGMYLAPQYGLKLDKSDPFRICREQKRPEFRHACYDDFKALILTISNNDFAKAAQYIESIQETPYAYDAMDNLATYYVYYLLKEPDLSKPINICHSLQSRIQVACIRGLGAGFMTAGIPDQEYVRAIQFCNSSLLTDEEKDACFERVIGTIYYRYSRQKAEKICATIDVKYQKYCE